MEDVSLGLSWAFTFIFYPAIVIGIFLALGATIIVLVNEESGSEFVRRLTAGILPLVGLVFIVVNLGRENDFLTAAISDINPWYRFGLGALVAVALLEAGSFFYKNDLEIGILLLILFLSTTFTFLVYSMMLELLSALNAFLFGVVVAGGMDVIFRGPPGQD